MKKVISLLRRFSRTKWNIGFVNKSELFSQKKFMSVRWMKHDYKDRWFADPFVLSETDDKIILLVEEFYDKKERGRLTKLTVCKETLRLIDSQVVLELNEHLSFPFILKYRGRIFIIPECYQSKKLNAYIYDESTGKLEFFKTVLDGEFTDAIFYSKTDGDFYIFTTEQPEPNGCDLNIYYSKNLLGEYKYLKGKSFNSKIARNAGGFFKIKGQLYRPVQNCNKRYGGGLILQEVIFKNNDIEFMNIRYVFPKSFKYNLGIHTLNMGSNFAVVDGLGYRNPVLGRIISFLKKMR